MKYKIKIKTMDLNPILCNNIQDDDTPIPIFTNLIVVQRY